MAESSLEENKGRALGVLYGEHALLGAHYSADGVLVRYAAPPVPLGEGGAWLAELSTLKVLRLAGSVAQTFAHTSFAGRKTAIGECAFEAVLTGDAGFLGAPLLARTGAAEYVVFDATARAEAVEGWLSFLAGISQGVRRPFAGLVQEDATNTHTALLVAGPGAREVLLDYTAGQPLPAPGHIAEVMLDAIPCIVLALPEPMAPCFLVLVPPRMSVPLWRSLLSFAQVSPCGYEHLRSLFAERMAWWPLLTNPDGTPAAQASALASWGLLRAQSDYVGARALNA